MVLTSSSSRLFCCSLSRACLSNPSATNAARLASNFSRFTDSRDWRNASTLACSFCCLCSSSFASAACFFHSSSSFSVLCWICSATFWDSFFHPSIKGFKSSNPASNLSFANFSMCSFSSRSFCSLCISFFFKCSALANLARMIFSFNFCFSSALNCLFPCKSLVVSLTLAVSGWMFTLGPSVVAIWSSSIGAEAKCLGSDVVPLVVAIWSSALALGVAAKCLGSDVNAPLFPFPSSTLPLVIPVSKSFILAMTFAPLIRRF
mmetsp:Transcript_92537/g.160397  ORF Transcript_92537/g.160397 Transcript_92537/m.160397 type:complete len:262 (-) Transcript_92537:108-893(-)